MIISVHLPKTAGTSFKSTLNRHFGNQLMLDYDAPLKETYFERNKKAIEDSLNISQKNENLINFECIHGHFLPVKYSLLFNTIETKFITWFRNPVDRIISHYYYAKKRFDNGIIFNPKHFNSNTTLEEFCLNPRLKNLYSQFLWNFPLEQFEFIGITEYYNEDLEFFVNNYLQNTDNIYNPVHLNNNTLNKIDQSKELRNVLSNYHAKDMDLYNKALELRRKRNLVAN